MIKPKYTLIAGLVVGALLWAVYGHALETRDSNNAASVTSSIGAVSNTGVLDINERAVVTVGCGASPRSITPSNAVTGDTLLGVAIDCAGNGVEACPAGWTAVANDATAGSTLLICKKVAGASDHTTAAAFTNASNQLAITVTDIFSNAGSAVTVGTAVIGACRSNGTTDSSGGSILPLLTTPLSTTAVAGPYLWFGAIAQQADIPELLNGYADATTNWGVGGGTGFIPVGLGTTIPPALEWFGVSGSSSECAGVPITG